MPKHAARFFKRHPFPTAADCAKTLAALLAATLMCVAAHRLMPADSSLSVVQAVYLLATFLVSRFTQGFFCGIFTAVAGILLTNYLFTYPYWAFNFILPGYPITILCTLSVSIITSTMTARIRAQSDLLVETERERMRSNLLRAISHDLRTPLTSILGASSAMLESGGAISEAENRALLSEIQEDAQWLIGMVENLLSVTRVDGGGAALRKAPEAAEEVVGEAVAQFRKRFPECAVCAAVPDELLLVPMDAMLIKQVLLNLLENVALHTPPGTAARLTVQREKQGARFCVCDNGPGIPPERLEHIFDGMFQRDEAAKADARRSMGIGLSVCSSIVKAHGGRMEAGNLPGGGAAFSFLLPLEEASISWQTDI